MAKSTEDFAKGNYISGITRIATQFDRMLAESTTQWDYRQQVVW